MNGTDDGARVFVHPMGLCESKAVGAGTRIWAFAHVLDGAVVGEDCNLGDGVYVEDGAVLGDRVVVKNGVSVWARITLEDDVFVGPAAAFTNDLVPRATPYRTPASEWLDTVVQTGACLGANSTIVCGVTIGAHALVGAGSVVTRDVPNYAVVAGNPARQLGWICRCGARLGETLACADCGRTFKVVDQGICEL